MESAELNSKAEIPAETLAVLAELSQEINASLNLDEVLASAATLVKRLIAYEIFAVLLLEEGTNQLYFPFPLGPPPRVAEPGPIPRGEGIIGAVAATGQPIRV